MECVTTTSISISINGSLYGYFKGKRGLRQGDPLLPYLFPLVMGILTLMIRRRVRDADLFTYHRYCSKLKLVNLCFADDLFLFGHGDANSASVIMNALDKFKQVSGLTPSLPKSTNYFCNVLNHVKLSILQILPFEKGRLPVKYLGVPLVLSRLIYRDCKELIEKVQKCVNDWKNKSLSTAGSFSRGKAKVAWEVVCLPKVEGGLGIRRLDTFNKAVMMSHNWKLLSLKESMWVQWIHAYKLRSRNFWYIPCRGNMTWGWRKILQLRPLIRDFIWHKLGDGSTTSAWYDRWCLHSPLANVISHRDLFREGFNQVTKVRDLMINGHLSWPHSWLGKYTMLSSIPDPVTVPNTRDMLEWRDSYGTANKFSVKTGWGSIRPRSNKVVWYHAVWFLECIP
ncbi:putative reverse transcriptase domain, reverse transcriptase zinc-binding domain protein [Tanacetum coccineum]